MPRANQLLLVFVLLAIIGGVGAWLYLTRNQKEYIPAAIALPNSAMVVYQGHTPQQDLKSLDHNPFFTQLSQNGGISSFLSDFRFADSLIQKEVIIQELLKEQPLIVSVHATSSQRFQLLFLIQTEGQIDAGDVKKWAEKKWAGARIFERTAGGKRIYDVKSRTRSLLFSYSFIENIFAFSQSTVLVEDAITAAASNSLKSSPLLTELVKKSGESRFYLNFKSFPEFLTTFSNPATSTRANGLRDILDFGSYSWRFSEQTLKLAGSAYVKPGDGFVPFLNQTPQPLKIADVIPSACAVLTQHGVDNFAAYYTNLKIIRKKSYETEAQELADRKAISLDKDVLPLLGMQWGHAILDPGEPNAEAERYLAVALNDTSAGWKAWNLLNEKAAPAGSAEFKGKAYREHVIHLFSMPDVLAWLFGEYAIEGPVYYTRIDAYLVFAKSAAALERAVDAYLDRQTLASTATYKEFTGQAGSNLTLSLYINPGRSQSLAQQYIGAGYKDRFLQNMPVYLNAGSIGFTLASSGNYFYSQIIVNKADAAPSGAEVAWSLSLEADAATKPFIVLDPDTRQKEIMIQDKNQNLYLVSAAGKILWKKDLEEQIVGEVYQIDLYRNNDLQYLFTTTNKVYLLNRQGNAAANYPIRLASPTHTGASLFDFANSREYTYYVGTEKGRVYGFEGNGKPLNGWSPLTLDGSITVPVKYFNVQKKDYLFSVTEKGSLYLWNKEGRNAAKPIALKAYFRNPFRMEFGAGFDQSAIFSVDTNGTLYTVYLDGKIQTQEYPDFVNPFFDYFDSDRNGKSEYIISSDTVIAAFDKEAKAAWRLRVPDKLAYPPQMVSSANQTYIAYTDAQTNQLYLVKTNGARYPSFPANGNSFITVTDIDADGMPELVAPASGQLLYMYRLTR